MKFYGAKLEKIRKAEGSSIKNLADSIGVNRASVWAWEKGRRQPRISAVVSLAKVLNICVSEISDMEPVKKMLPVDYSSSAKVLSSINVNMQSKVIKKLRNDLDLLDGEFSKTSTILNSLISAIDTAFYLKGIDGKFIMANKAYLKLLGLNTNYSVQGKSDKELFSQKEAERNRKLDYDVLMSGQPLKNVEGYIPGTRKKRWGLFSRIPLVENDEYVSGLIVTITDITDRKKEEQRRLLLESALDNIEDGVWISKTNDDKKNNCSIKYLNKVFEDWTGYSRDYAYKNQSFWKEFVNSHEVRRHEKGLNRKSDRIADKSFEIRTKSNEVLSVNEKIFNFDDMKLGIIRNHTQEEGLIKANHILRSLVDSADEIIWYSNIGSENRVEKLDFMNDSVYSITGLNPDDLKRNYCLWETIVYNEDLAKYKLWRDSKEFPKEMDYRIVNRVTGKIIWLNAKAYNVNNVRYGIIKDISDSKKNEMDAKHLNLYKEILFEYFDKPATGYWIQEIIPDNKVLYVNKGYLSVMGLNRDELLNDTNVWRKCICQDDLSYVENFEPPAEGENILLKYKVNNRKTGKTVNVENQVFQISNADKHVLGGFINVIA